MYIFICTTLILLSSNIFASFLPMSSCDTLNAVGSIYISEEIKTPCSVIKEVESVVLNIQEFSKEKAVVTLFLDKPSYMAQTSISGLMILSQRQKGWEETRSLEKTKIIWAHEYGHVIFNQMMLRDFREATPFHLFMTKLDEYAIKARDPFLDSFDKVKELWSEEIALLRDIQKPYSELFADLVAILYQEDKKALSFAMKATGMDSKNLAELEYYDFEGKENRSPYSGEDLHFVFSKFKLVLGKMIKFPMSKKAKFNLLKSVHSIIVSEMRNLYLQKKKPKDFDYLNDSLIKKILESPL